MTKRKGGEIIQRFGIGSLRVERVMKSSIQIKQESANLVVKGQIASAI